MNDIHVGNIRMTRAQTREDAARELKVFLNEVLTETCPELGLVDQVSLPLEYQLNAETGFGFITMVNRHCHLKMIEMLDRVVYKYRGLLLTPAKRTSNTINCRAVRESRKKYQKCQRG